VKLHELAGLLNRHPDSFPRFVLPDGDRIPAHAHITEIGHVIKNFVDCGGLTGKEEKVLLQTHVGDDKEHRLRSDRLARILQLGNRVLPSPNLDVVVEYDCCVVAQYPIAEAVSAGHYLDLILQRAKTQCRARDRRESKEPATCCSSASVACC
jgi:Family of unknown function (DUF6428)